MVGITPQDKLNGAAVNVVARTADAITYIADRPALVLLDHDTKGMPPEVRERMAGGFWSALVQVLPELAGVGHVTRSSTSAGLHRSDTDEPVKGSDGLHIYIAALNGRDIPRFLTTLHDRCWLNGLGWMMVGAAGQLLERSIVDRMVGASERLVFEGRPPVEPPLVQDQQSCRPVFVDGEMLDTGGGLQTV